MSRREVDNSSTLVDNAQRSRLSRDEAACKWVIKWRNRWNVFQYSPANLKRSCTKTEANCEIRKRPYLRHYLYQRNLEYMINAPHNIQVIWIRLVSSRRSVRRTMNTGMDRPMKHWTFPQAFAPVQSNTLFHWWLSFGIIEDEPIPAPPIIWASFGTKVSTSCSCSGCLWDGSSKTRLLVLTELLLPSLDYFQNVVLNHFRPSVIVLPWGCRKWQETIKFGAHITCRSYCFIILHDFLEEFLHNLKLSVNNRGMKIAYVCVHVYKSCT